MHLHTPISDGSTRGEPMSGVTTRSKHSLPHVAVIVLNWRRPEDTIACVESVAALDYATLDIIVCDNDSGDGSYRAIAQALTASITAINQQRSAADLPGFALDEVASDTASAPHAQHGRLWLTQTGRNGGYAFGNNVGIRLALLAPDVDYVWVLNNDTLVDPHALSQLIDHAERHPDIGICGATAVYLEDPAHVQTLGGGRFIASRARCEQIGEGVLATAPIDQSAIEQRLSYVNGAAALVRRTLIDRIGPMDEGYFLYWEELDWATRMRKSTDFRLGYCAAAIVYHRVGAATGSSDQHLPSDGSTYWITRSKFRFLRLHRPLSFMIAFPLLFKTVLAEVAAGRRGRARTMLRAAFGMSQGT